MGSGRQDVQRLFGHFGLDPADYVVSFARPGDAANATAAADAGKADAGTDAERDSYERRNLELTR